MTESGTGAATATVTRREGIALAIIVAVGFALRASRRGRATSVSVGLRPRWWSLLRAMD